MEVLKVRNGDGWQVCINNNNNNNNNNTNNNKVFIEKYSKNTLIKFPIILE